MFQNIPKTIDVPTELAIVRTRLSAERTLLSWIRTAFAMITFGFGIIKFFQYFKAISHIEHHPSLASSSFLGAFLIIMGILSLIPGYIEHRKTLHALAEVDGRQPWSYASALAIAVAVIGIYALINAEILDKLLDATLITP